MTHEEAVLVSAYTGVLLTKSFKNVQDFCEKLLGRPVFTHELANEGVLKEIQEKCLPEIVKMIDREVDGSGNERPEYYVGNTICDKDLETIRKELAKGAVLAPYKATPIEGLRPCKATSYKDGKAEDVFGYFHQWGVNYEEFETGPGNFTTAIIETFGGAVVSCPAETVEFLHWSEGSSECAPPSGSRSDATGI